MPWESQNPPARDVVATLRPADDFGRVHGTAGAHIEIDRLADGSYRATVGDLCQCRELMRSPDLEQVLRQANALVWAPDRVTARRVLQDMKALSSDMEAAPAPGM